VATLFAHEPRRLCCGRIRDDLLSRDSRDRVKYPGPLQLESPDPSRPSICTDVLLVGAMRRVRRKTMSRELEGKIALITSLSRSGE
jgi:hypothetical protein